jgi:hypothetical protein
MRLLYDGLAIIDVVGGYLLAVIGLQRLYIKLFHAMHGGPDGVAKAPTVRRR